MYAIALDIDSAAMEAALDDTAAGFDEIAALLEREGFEDQGGSVFFGVAGSGPIEAVLATQRLAAEVPWLAGCVRAMRLLRVADETDLLPAFSAGRQTLQRFPS